MSPHSNELTISQFLRVKLKQLPMPLPTTAPIIIPLIIQLQMYERLNSSVIMDLPVPNATFFRLLVGKIVERRETEVRTSIPARGQPTVLRRRSVSRC